MLELSVVIPTYNRLSSLQKCLQYLERQTLETERYEIVIVDNGPSTDGTGDFLFDYAAKHKHVRVITTEQPGVTYARQRGAQEAHGTYQLQIDDDTMLKEAGTLADVLAAFASTKADALTGLETNDIGRVSADSGKKRIGAITHFGRVYTNYSDILFRNERTAPIDHARSCFMAYSKAVFEKVNGFDCYYDDLTGGMGYRGETDFCYKIIQEGGTMMLVQDIEYTHDEAPRSERVVDRASNNTYYGYVYATHALFVFKLLPTSKIAWCVYQLFIGDIRVPGLLFILIKRLNPFVLMPMLLRAIIRMYKETRSYNEKQL